MLILLAGFISGQEICFAYRSSAVKSDGFVAVGPGMDFFSPDGVKLSSVELPDGADLNCVAISNGILAAGGKGGMMLFVSEAGKVREGSRLDGDVSSLASFKNGFVASVTGGKPGRLYFYKDSNAQPQEISTGANGNVISLAASGSQCYGVTDKGEIVHSKDGRIWDVFDFNRNYEGYYRAVDFSSVAVDGSGLAVVGTYPDGSPAMYMSSRGTVWSERGLFYRQDGDIFFFDKKPLGLTYDRAASQYVMLCEDGTLFVVPGCSQCNQPLIVGTKGIRSLSFGPDGTPFAAGDDGFAKVIDR